MNALISMLLLAILSPFGPMLHSVIQNCNSSEACATLDGTLECPQPNCDPEACPLESKPRNCKENTMTCPKIAACEAQASKSTVDAKQSPKTNTCKSTSACPGNKSSL